MAKVVSEFSVSLGKDGPPIYFLMGMKGFDRAISSEMDDPVGDDR